MQEESVRFYIANGQKIGYNRFRSKGFEGDRTLDLRQRDLTRG